MAWSVLILGVVVYALKDLGAMPFNKFTTYTLSIGVALQAILLSFVLANHINVLNAEKEDANDEVLQQIKRNEDLVRNQNRVLEEKVASRTLELQTTLDELKAAQSQLVQSEKMASLGVLTAGIAHEINNPINFVSANVIPLRENLYDISKLLKMYQDVTPENIENELPKIEKYEKEIELDYLYGEIEELIAGINVGAERTQNIVSGLKTFAQGDAGERIRSDIYKGLKSTKATLKNKVKHIVINEDFDPDLPLVACRLGKINQVLLNIFNNAVEALEEKNGPNSKNSKINIETKFDDKNVYISIEDNGIGISEENKKRITEPFFTTKEVGKGTGLGMSISYSILQEHNGDLIVESVIGKGTKFTIRLPIDTADGV